MNENNELRESILREILTEEIYGYESLFEYLRECFEKILKSKSDVVVFMARKAFCLYRAFEPFLTFKARVAAEKKLITHDIALFNYDILKFPNSKILVVDDTLLFGRTIAKCIENIIKYLEHHKIPDPEKQIQVFNMIVGDKYIVNHKPDEGVTEKSWQTYFFGGYFYFPKTEKINGKAKIIEGCRKIRAFGGRIHKVTLSETRRISISHVKAIFATGIPYNGYSPSFGLEWTDENFGKIFEKRPKDYSEIENSLSQRIKASKLKFTDITSDIQREDLFSKDLLNRINHEGPGMISFILEEPRPQCIEPKDYVYRCLRIYVNFVMKKISIIPYATIPSVRKTCDAYHTLLNQFKEFNKLNEEDWEIKKGRFDLSHLCGECRIKRYIQAHYIYYVCIYKYAEDFLGTLDLKYGDYEENDKAEYGICGSEATILHKDLIDKFAPSNETNLREILEKGGLLNDIRKKEITSDDVIGNEEIFDDTEYNILKECLEVMEKDRGIYNPEELMNKYFGKSMLNKDFPKLKDRSIERAPKVALFAFIKEVAEACGVCDYEVRRQLIKICDQGTANVHVDTDVCEDVTISRIQSGEQAALGYGYKAKNAVTNILWYMYNLIEKDNWKKINAEQIYKKFKSMLYLNDGVDRTIINNRELSDIRAMLNCNSPESFEYKVYDIISDDAEYGADSLFMGFAHYFSMYVTECEKNKTYSYDVDKFFNNYIHDAEMNDLPHIKPLRDFFPPSR